MAGGSRPALGGRPDRGEDPLRGPRDGRRGDSRAGSERGRLHPAPGGVLPAGARDLRPPRRAADLRRGDLRLGAARALVRLRALRLHARHHHDGKGPYLRLRADGRDDRLRPGRRAVHGGKEMFAHGFTFAGHPVAAAAAMANLDVFEREDLCGHVLRKEGEFRGDARVPARHPDRRRRARRRLLPRDRAGQGPGDEGGQFTDEESEWLLRGFLSGELFRRGLICRADDRGDPVIQLAPPLICDTEQFEEIESVLRPVLTEAWDAGQGLGLMLTVGSLRRRLRPRAGRREPTAPSGRSAGCTSPSSRTRPRGCRAASSC